MLKRISSIYSISAKIDKKEMARAKDYIQGAVHAYCKNCSGDITVRALFGGENRDWHGTPLQAIYDYYDKNGYENSYERAAQDVGKLLKIVLQEDKWEYEEKSDFVKAYIKK